MLQPNESWDPRRVWTPYAPDAKAPWNLCRVVHLHRRAGFGATWGELQRDLNDGPGRSVDRLLAGTARAGLVSEEFERTARALADAAAVPSSRATLLSAEGRERSVPEGPARLKGWWAYRMFRGPDPLGERLTLMWHDHFATSNLKVRHVAAMRRQNETMRRSARGTFAELLGAMVRDPALLEWLDAATNRRGRPNENLARELMELFTLGIGNYSEQDVRQAARCLTGWAPDEEGNVRLSEELHDEGEKTVLGRTGRWAPDDLVRILLEHPATARRLAWRLCGLLMGEGAADAAALAALAAGLRANRLEIGWAVGTVLRSRLFFADANIGTRVLGPVEYAVGAARALEFFDPPPRSQLIGHWAARMGQDLFYPPNVGGWPGGREWLTTQFVIARANYAVALAEGRLTEPPAPVDGVALAARHGRDRDPRSVLAFVAELLTGAPASAPWVRRLAGGLPVRGAEAEIIAAAVALVIAAPEAQLA